LRYNDPLLERRGGVKIKHRHYPQNAEVVDIEGEIDYNTSPKLRAELQKILEQKPKTLMFNLRKVSYVDSSGLAVFIELFQKIKQYQGKLVLFNLAEGIRSVFEIAKLDSIFHLAKTEEEALAAAD